ncbi:MAG: triose-phosphate isomerase, partial [Gemmatimonadota bacterium]
MAGQKVIAGNWKMNIGPEETRRFFQDFSPSFSQEGACELLFFPPALSLAVARDSRPDHLDVGLGVQNIHWER